MTARSIRTTLAAAILGGGLVGGIVHGAAAAALPEERASAAVVVVLAVALALGPLGGLRRFGAVLSAVAAGLAAATSVLVAGGGLASAGGAALVVAGIGALGAGAAGVAQRLGAASGASVMLGAVLPALLAASVFVADPIIEWDGSGRSSPPLAHWIYRTNPIAAATSPVGGTGIDWQTRSLMYDGHGSGGLSVIGQYYPARPPSAPLWGAFALLIGAGLACVGSPRGVRPVIASRDSSPDAAAPG